MFVKMISQRGKLELISYLVCRCTRLNTSCPLFWCLSHLRLTGIKLQILTVKHLKKGNLGLSSHFVFVSALRQGRSKLACGGSTNIILGQRGQI